MYKYKRLKLADGSTKDEHRLVMEKHLNRLLHIDEVVHHVDGNKRNNTIDNLQVMSRKEHNQLHRKLGDIISTPISEKGKIQLCTLNSVVSEDTAKWIKYSEEPSKIVQQKFGVSKYVISRIRNNSTWKHI